MFESQNQLPYQSLWRGGGLALAGALLFALGMILFLWDQSRSVPSGNQAQSSTMSGSVGYLTPPSSGNTGYSIILIEGIQAATRHRFAVSKYMYDTLNSTITAGGVPRANQVKASYNRQTGALYLLTFITPQHDPVYNTEQDVFGNMFIVIGTWVIGALLLIFGIFTTMRMYLDRIAPPVTVIATVMKASGESDIVEMRLTPINDLYHKGKPFTILISPAQYNPVSFAPVVEVSLSPTQRHVYGIRPHSTFVA